MSNPPPAILADRRRFDEWRTINPTVTIVGGKLDLPDWDMQETTNIPPAGFERSCLVRAKLQRADLHGVSFASADLSEARLDGANLEGASFSSATLRAAHLPATRARGIVATAANLTEVRATEADFTDSNFKSANCEGADLSKATLDKTDLTGVRLAGADLRGASLRGAQLTNTVWQGARIDSSTDFVGSHWVSAEHDSANDGAERLGLPTWRKRLRWSSSRFLGHTSLFAGAYVLLSVALATATAIAWLNESEFLTVVDYPIPLPDRLLALLIGSALLAIGTTIFDFRCPAKVRDYAFTTWVYELGRPGVLYVSEDLRRPIWAGVTYLVGVAGGVITGLLFIDRIWAVIKITWSALTT